MYPNQGQRHTLHCTTISRDKWEKTPPIKLNQNNRKHIFQTFVYVHFFTNIVSTCYVSFHYKKKLVIFQQM